MRYRFFLQGSPLLFASCSEYSKISRIIPEFHPFRANVRSASNFEQQFTNAREAGKRDPLQAHDEYLATAQTAELELHKNPNSREARDSYNFAVSRIFSVIQTSKMDPWTQPLVLEQPHGRGTERVGCALGTQCSSEPAGDRRSHSNPEE